MLSCGKDNDDIIKPEDVINIDFDEGLLFGKVELNCDLNCGDAYLYTNDGVFVAEEQAFSVDNPTISAFSACPIMLEDQVVNRLDDVKNVPRALRDVPSTSFMEAANLTTSANLFFIEYRVKDKNIPAKTIQFSNSESLNEQISQYFGFIISTVEGLDSRNVTAPTNCNNI